MGLKLFAMGLMLCSLSAVTAYGQKAIGNSRRQNIPPGSPSTFNSSNSENKSLNANSFAESPLRSAKSEAGFELSYIDGSVIEEFRKAWIASGNGIWNVEGLVLIYRNLDGSYRAESLGMTNEDRKFTFKWDPDAIAIIHTHPNDRDPRPHEPDKAVADKVGVPIFTITSRGMYVYYPRTRETSKVLDGLDWLDLNKWRQMHPTLTNP